MGVTRLYTVIFETINYFHILVRYRVSSQFISLKHSCCASLESVSALVTPGHHCLWGCYLSHDH